MNLILIPRARTAAALWTSIVILGVAIALHSMVGLAATRGLLPWQVSADDTGRLLLRFIAGVALSCLALWGIYKQTVHHVRDEG